MAVLQDKDLLVTLKQLKADKLGAFNPSFPKLALSGHLNSTPYLAAMPCPGPALPAIWTPPTVVRGPWVPPVREYIDGTTTTRFVREPEVTISSAVQSASFIQALREDINDLMMADKN